jgi:hypothetical protein
MEALARFSSGLSARCEMIFMGADSLMVVRASKITGHELIDLVTVRYVDGASDMSGRQHTGPVDDHVPPELAAQFKWEVWETGQNHCSCEPSGKL